MEYVGFESICRKVWHYYRCRKKSKSESRAGIPLVEFKKACEYFEIDVAENELNLTEGRGTGLPKIRRFMLNNGSPEPVFETDNDSVYFLTTLPIHSQFEVEPSESQLAIRVLSLLASGALSKSELSKKLGQKAVSGELNKQIKRLLNKVLIERTIPDKPNSRLQKYRLTQIGADLNNSKR